jgi:GH24 family phage-related lysozyme (muramidase)
VRKNLTRPDGTQVPVTQSMFDALVSYVYNSGDEPNAPIWRALRAGDYDEAARILRNPRTPGENRTAGVPENVRQGLQARRNREADLFDKDGRPDRRAVVGPPPVPTPPPGSDKPRMSDVPTPQRDGFRYVDDRGKIIYNASITDALIDYARRINPSLTPAEARRIAGAVMAVYQDPTKQPDEWYGFDPLAIMGIIAARSRFTPGYRDPSQDRHGLMGLRPSDAPGLPVQDLYDPVKNVRAGIEAFRSVEARLGTRGALEYFGISWSDWIAYSGRVLGLYPVTYNPRVPLERGVRTPNLPIGGAAAAGTPEERAVAEVMTRLAQAGGNPDDPGYLARRRQEWAQIIERASPDVLRRMQIVAPDLWREIEQIRRGGPTWYRGQAVIEDVGVGPDAQPYAAWKRQVLMAETREEALKAYLAGTPAQRERFAIYNREMARFFEDAQEGVWWSPQWEFSARAGDEKYLAARHKLARAVATGDRGIVRQVTREIRSMFGDDVPGFLRTLRQDTPGVFEIVAPYLQGQEYTAEMKLRVREFRLQIEGWIKKAQADPEALGQAAAAWKDPANAGIVDLIEEHEPEWYAKTQRLLQDEPPIGHYVPITQTMEFERWRMRLAEAYRSRDMEALQKVWSDPEVPETFRQELKTHELRDYLRYEPMLNGVEPAEWVAHREREAYSPYLSYLSMNDLYGPWSPQKLKQILEENPAAVEWILRDPENRLRYRSALESRVVGLYAGTLKAYNYHPALLNAIPDDGTRHWLALMDPAAAEAFARYGVRVTPTERPLIPAVRSAAEVYGAGSVVEPIRPTDGGPVRKYRVRTPNMEDREIDTQQLITDLGLAVETPAMSRAFAAQAQQWTQAKGIVQALQFVGQGVEIGIRGGGFMEQLPSYFSAFQAAAGAGLFGPAAAAFATGPAGIIIGGVLGILGGIFGASRQAAEQARQRAIAIARARFQASGQAFDLRERLRSLSKQELTTLDARTGAVTAFLEKPSAITRQGLVDALKLPTPSW